MILDIELTTEKNTMTFKIVLYKIGQVAVSGPVCVSFAFIHPAFFLLLCLYRQTKVTLQSKTDYINIPRV